REQGAKEVSKLDRILIFAIVANHGDDDIANARFLRTSEELYHYSFERLPIRVGLACSPTQNGEENTVERERCARSAIEVKGEITHIPRMVDAARFDELLEPSCLVRRELLQLLENRNAKGADRDISLAVVHVHENRNDECVWLGGSY